MAVRATCQQWLGDKRQASSRSAGDSAWDHRAWYPVQCPWRNPQKKKNPPNPCTCQTPKGAGLTVSRSCNRRERPSPEVHMYSNHHCFLYTSIISPSPRQTDAVFVLCCVVFCWSLKKLGIWSFGRVIAVQAELNQDEMRILGEKSATHLQTNCSTLVKHYLFPLNHICYSFSRPFNL